MRPWPSTGLSTRAWLHVPPVLLPLDAIVTVQDVRWEAVQHAITDPARSWCGDPAPHVIDWHGRWWLEDGHHRVRAAVLRAETHVWCRVWPIDPSLL